jgi:RNA polymerase sigma-70 factor (ECF subfamily)
LLGQRLRHHARGFVNLGELARQCVLRLQQPVLDDQEFVVRIHNVPDLVAVDRAYLVSLHAPPSPRGEYQRTYPRSRENKRIGRVADMSEPTQTEARRIAEEARDRVRFEEEALELSDQVFRVARHLVGSREEAEDLMQDTYARAFRSWRSFTPGTNLRAWLLRILTNLNIDRGRRQQRAPQTTSNDEHGDYYLYDKHEAAEGKPLDEERVIERLSQGSIVDALANVPHDFRDVLVLVDIGDFSYADAAQILDIPIGTVMSRLHRARRILKGELAEEVV